MTEFPGFDAEDFDVFTIPEFYSRMSAIRTRVRPKLATLGDEMAEKLPVLDGDPFYPHTASHARRRVNPPEDTWVAFSRSPRGYKRYAHFEVGITHDLVFVRFVVKPEGLDDKPALINFLQKTGLEGMRLEASKPLYWYRDDHGSGPAALDSLTSEQFSTILEQVRLKTRGFTVGATFPASAPIVGSRRLIGAAVRCIEDMWPLYQGVVSRQTSVTRT